MKMLVLLAAFVSSAAMASDLKNRKSENGQRCSVVVSQLLARQVGSPVRLLSYENLTPGSYNQEYRAVFKVGTQSHVANLTGNFDCDDLKIVSLN